MLETSHCLRARSSIRELKKLDNNLIAIATLGHGVKLFAPQECKNKTSLFHKYLNAQATAVSFSPNAEFVAFAKESYLFILHIPSEIVLKTIKADGEIIQKLEFDLESKYIFAATQSGRVLQYRYDGSSLLGRLYSFKQAPSRIKSKISTISSFAFHKNIMACGGNNGTIFTINLHSRTNKLIIKNDGASRITSLCFLNDAKLLSTDSLGSIYINCTKTTKLLKKISTGFTTITQALLMPNPQHLMLIGGTKDAAVYDTGTLKLLHSKYVEFEDIITGLEILNDNTLIATLKYNSIEKIHLSSGTKLKSLIISNELTKAYDLVKKDPLLLSTKEFEVLEIAYNKLYMQALNALTKGNKAAAFKITQNFKYIDAKKNDIEILYRAFDNYPRFKTLYMEKKYALAYAMAAKFPPLRKTFQYDKMEELWRDTCDNAQRQISYGHNDNALTLLKTFATILEKRPYIKLILNHNDAFMQFSQAIQEKDYKTVYNLSVANPIFTLLEEYRVIKEDIDKELLHVQKHIKKSELNTAVKKLTKLRNIHPIQERVDEHKEDCLALKKMQNAYKAGNFIQCYEVIDHNPFLNTTKLGELLEKHWLKIIHNCEGFALKGNIKNIKETLGEFILLETRRDKIGDLFRLAFHTKIKALISKKSYKKAELIIYSYIDIFGLDNEITSIMQTYENKSKMKLALTYDADNREKRDKWINATEIMGEYALHNSH